MDGVGTPIIGRPRPLPGHDTPNPAYHPHTLNYEEPSNMAPFSRSLVARVRYSFKSESRAEAELAVGRASVRAFVISLKLVAKDATSNPETVVWVTS